MGEDVKRDPRAEAEARRQAADRMRGEAEPEPAPREWKISEAARVLEKQLNELRQAGEPDPALRWGHETDLSRSKLEPLEIGDTELVTPEEFRAQHIGSFVREGDQVRLVVPDGRGIHYSDPGSFEDFSVSSQSMQAEQPSIEPADPAARISSAISIEAREMGLLDRIRFLNAIVETATRLVRETPRPEAGSAHIRAVPVDPTIEAAVELLNGPSCDHIEVGERRLLATKVAEAIEAEL